VTAPSARPHRDRDKSREKNSDRQPQVERRSVLGGPEVLQGIAGPVNKGVNQMSETEAEVETLKARETGEVGKERETGDPRQLTLLVRSLPRVWLLIVGVLLTMLTSASIVYLGHLLRVLMDAALGLDWVAFWRVSYLFLGLQLARFLLIYTRTKTVGAYAEDGVTRLRQTIVERIARLPMAELSEIHSGDFVSRLTNDLNRIRVFIQQTLIGLIDQPLTAVLAFAYLCWLDWRLTLILTLAMPLILFISMLLSKPMGRLGKERQEWLAQVNSVAQDTITGIEVARAFNLTGALNERYGDAVDQSVRASAALASRRALVMGSSFFMSIIPFLLLFGIGGYWSIQGDMTPGSLIAFVNLLNRLTNPMAQLPRLVGEFRADMAAAKRVFAILNLGVESTTGIGAVDADGPEAIAVDNLRFSYPNRDRTALDGISFSVERGKTVAIVGPSGSGKTTLFRILLGLYDEYQGDIEIFGRGLQDWNLEALRQSIAFVTQDTYLFPGTIAENIAYGRQGATPTEIAAAARAANASEFIAGLPQGLDTSVGELGGKLSGGQRQRIAIARAILKDAPILLLDEATSALDTRSEALVQEALDEFMADRTTLVIAHRLSTIKNADWVLVLDDGRIAEEGTHDDLLAREGLYHHLYTRQFADSEREAV